MVSQHACARVEAGVGGLCPVPTWARVGRRGLPSLNRWMRDGSPSDGCRLVTPPELGGHLRCRIDTLTSIYLDTSLPAEAYAATYLGGEL
jgi:hypothetical protein